MKICRNGKKNTIQILILSSLFFMLEPNIAYAGSINGNEAKVLNNMGATYEYEGKKYKMSSGYIGEARAYLSQDGVELSAEDAQEVLNMAFGNIGQGVADGYLIEVGQTQKEESEQSQEEESEQTQKEESEQSHKGESEQSHKGESGQSQEESKQTGSEKVEASGVSPSEEKIIEPEYSLMTNEEKSEIEIKDSDGKKVLSLPVVIKNTGFSIRKTILFASISAVLGIALLIVTAKQYLFALNHEE